MTVITRIIREPTSLVAAEMEYERQVKYHGYHIVSDLKSYWQECLFRDTKDAVVSANVERN